MKIKEVKESCNCIWKHCGHHKDGAVCPNDAIGYDCGGCETIHWLGDKSLGFGFRLCTDCAGEIMEFIGDALPQLMHDLAPYVPDTLKCLEGALKSYYLGYISQEKSDLLDPETGEHMRGWRHPLRDSRALIEFAGIIIMLKDQPKKIPTKVLEFSLAIAKKHKDLVEAFSDFESETLLKEESK